MVIEKSIKKEQFLWEVCGHEKIVDYLKSSILSDNLHHAYIFAGQSGLGKGLVAEKFIKTLYCLNKDQYLPCENCSNCRQINAKVFPDIYYVRRMIDEKTGKLKREIAINQIRELKLKLSQASLLSSWRIAVIEEAEFLNINSSNSLLKVLEEPGKKTILILLANDLSRVLKTIDSRCQTLNFLPVSKEKIKNFLISKNLDDNKAGKIAGLSVGRPGQAVKLMENSETYNEIKIDIENFLKITSLNLSQRFDLLDSLIDWQKDETLNISRLIRLLNNWLVALRDLMLKKTENEYYFSGGCEQCQSFKKPLSYSDVLRINQLINNEYKNLKYNISSKNILENLIINI